MPIDAGGTAPGLKSGSEAQHTVLHMKCKRPECPSNQVIEVKQPGAVRGQHLYRCVKCHTSWGVNTGGPVDL